MTPTCQPDDETLRAAFQAFDLEEMRCRERVSESIVLDRIEIVSRASGRGVLMYKKDMHSPIFGFNGKTYAEAERKLLDVLSGGAWLYYRDRMELVDVPAFRTAEELEMKLEVSDGRA